MIQFPHSILVSYRLPVPIPSQYQSYEEFIHVFIYLSMCLFISPCVFSSLHVFFHLSMCFFLQSFQLQLMSPSSNMIPANNGGSVTQVIRINNPQKVSPYGLVYNLTLLVLRLDDSSQQRWLCHPGHTNQ